MKAAQRIVNQIDLFMQTGNREFLREAKAIAECIVDNTPVIASVFSSTLADALKQPCTD